MTVCVKCLMQVPGHSRHIGTYNAVIITSSQYMSSVQHTADVHLNMECVTGCAWAGPFPVLSPESSQEASLSVTSVIFYSLNTIHSRSKILDSRHHLLHLCVLRISSYIHPLSTQSERRMSHKPCAGTRAKNMDMPGFLPLRSSESSQRGGQETGI